MRTLIIDTDITENENTAFFKAILENSKMQICYFLPDGSFHKVPLKKKTARQMIKETFKYFLK